MNFNLTLSVQGDVYDIQMGFYGTNTFLAEIFSC